MKRAEGEPRARWRSGEGGFVQARAAHWKTPPFAVEPGGYYRLTFRARGDPGGMWFTDFYDHGGTRIDADHVSGIEPSGEWKRQTYHFQARPHTPRADMRFRPGERGTIALSEVTITPSTAAATRAWMDRVYDTMTPLPAAPPEDAVQSTALPPSVRRALRRGEDLRVVVLGDSIANDVTNSHFDLLVERRHPETSMEVIPVVRSGTGCPYYAKKNRVRSRVLPFEPDLVLIGGISNAGPQHDLEKSLDAVRRVIEQIRADGETAVVLQTGAAAGFGVAHLDRHRRRYAKGLRRLAERDGVAFHNLRAAWDAYVDRLDGEDGSLKRDGVHMNHRGRQVAARATARFFAQEQQAP
jgi:lysophospholipase L1-like esterase